MPRGPSIEPSNPHVAESTSWRERAPPTLTPPSQRTAAEKEAANKAHTESHATLRALQKASGGCADCTARMSGWAALPHGAFICINCAQIHRRIGRHISQVKAVNTGTYVWCPDEIAVMAYGGNARVQAEYCAAADAPPRPEEGAPVQEKEQYIRRKYEERRWYTAGGVQSKATASPPRSTRPSRGVKTSSSSASKMRPTPVRRSIPNVMDDDSGFRTWKAGGSSGMTSPIPMAVGCTDGDFFGAWGV
eukprot:m.443077 g.443077  ORF g.443077 m.443077 type:complete len:248 (+) comp18917_c0_seq1:159-902(+)